MSGSEEHAEHVIGSAVAIRLEDAVLDGDLAVPDGARALVLFAHGSGSSRHSPRNRQVAAGLQATGFATFLMDLLTAEEEQVDLRTRRLRFDIGLLARRLIGVTDWVAAGGDGAARHIAQLPVGTFGASTGAAAALIAAAERPDRVRAVVSRGGRPDLAADALPRVGAPVLLIVGGADPIVIELNQQAAAQLAHCELVVVPGAGHLFEEPGALEQVTRLAASWFDRWLAPTTS
jgi:putative phosphoribosyl transferase